MNLEQAYRPCRGSCSLILGRGCFGDLPGDEIVVSPPSPIFESLNIRQNPLCVESCVIREFAMSPRFSPTIFDPNANSVDSMRRKRCVRNCSKRCEGLYNGDVQQNPLCAASCVTKNIPISPRFPPTIFHRRANPAPYSARFLIHSSPN